VIKTLETVKGFEVAIASLVKVNQDRHDFGIGHYSWAVSGLFFAGRQRVARELDFELLAEIIDRNEKFE
jgi:hypothetical protein